MAVAGPCPPHPPAFKKSVWYIETVGGGAAPASRGCAGRAVTSAQGTLVSRESLHCAAAAWAALPTYL